MKTEMDREFRVCQGGHWKYKGMLLQNEFQPIVLSLRALNIFPLYRVCR